MTPMLAEWKARLAGLLGGCRRCTRTSQIAALCAWAAALLALIVLRNVAVVLTAALLATALTALFIAHRLAQASRGTLASMLRQFGAEPREAREIIAALRLPEGSGGSGAVRLGEGAALTVQRAERPDKAGFRLTRIVIAHDGGVIAAAALMPDGAYAPLDPANIEAVT
jgi:hypothetical protein